MATTRTNMQGGLKDFTRPEAAHRGHPSKSHGMRTRTTSRDSLDIQDDMNQSRIPHSRNTDPNEMQNQNRQGRDNVSEQRHSFQEEAPPQHQTEGCPQGFRPGRASTSTHRRILEQAFREVFNALELLALPLALENPTICNNLKSHQKQVIHLVTLSLDRLEQA